MPPDAPVPTLFLAIRPKAGRRVILQDGGQTLDGLAIPSGADLPAEGGLVPPALWVHRRLMDDDAEAVPDEAVAAGREAAQAREAAADAPIADTTATPARSADARPASPSPTTGASE